MLPHVLLRVDLRAGYGRQGARGEAQHPLRRPGAALIPEHRNPREVGLRCFHPLLCLGYRRASRPRPRAARLPLSSATPGGAVGTANRGSVRARSRLRLRHIADTALATAGAQPAGRGVPCSRPCVGVHAVCRGRCGRLPFRRVITRQLAVPVQITSSTNYGFIIYTKMLS